MRQFKKLIVFSLVLILTVSSVISSYSIPVRADTRTVEDQRQSILNRCVELENQYTTKAISEYTLLYNLRIITEIGMYSKLIEKETSLNFSTAEKTYYCEKYKTLVEQFNKMYSTESSKYDCITLSDKNFNYENVKENLINVIPSYLDKELGTIQKDYDSATDTSSKEKVLKKNTVTLSNLYKIVITYQDVQKDLTSLTPLKADNTSKTFSIVEGENNNETAKKKINKLITTYSKILTVGKEAYEETLKSVDLNVSDTEDYITELCDAQMYQGQVVSKESYTLKGAYFAILAASGTYIPLQSYAGNDTFTKSLIKLTNNETTAKNLINLYNNTKDYRKPLYKRSIDSNGNPTGTAKLLTVSEFFKDIEEGNSGALVAIQGKLKYSAEANAWVYYKDDLADTVTQQVQDSFSTDDNTDTEGDEVDKSKDTGDTITLDSLEKDYKNGEKKKIEVSNYNDLTSLQNLVIDLIETKGDYDAAQQLKANKTILNPIQDRFKNDCSEIKKMAGMTNFKDPALTSTVGTILAQVLAIKYKGIKLETAISRLQLTMDVYKAVNGKTGKQCYEDAKTYLTEKPIATYISGISKIYGGNEITKSTAKSYADKAIAKGNNKGIFVFTGDVSKGCIALAQDFKQKNVKGFSRSKEFTYGGAGTKYRYIMAEYKENGFYYPKGSKAKSFSINGTKYNFSTGEKVSQNGGTVSGILKALAQPFTPLEVQAAKATKDNTNTTDTSTDGDTTTNGESNTDDGDTTTNGESNTDDDTTSNNDSESNTTVTTTTATTQNPAVESIQAKKYDLDSATYSYEEVTDENIMSQPLLFYGTEYERAVDNTTSAVLRNILKNASALSVIKSKSSRFLYVNCYGDIVTDDNLVILPGASNPLLYNDNENYNPYTAAFMNNYPSIITNSENLQFTSKNDVGKYLAMANTYDEDYTDTDIKAYLVSGDDSVDETSEITLAKLQREFYANNVDSLNILSTGRYAVGSYQNWKNSDLYAWSSIVMKKTPLVDDKIIFPYVPKDDLDGSVGASIASNLYTFYTKDASDTGSTSKLNDNYICHNFIFCNSNGTNDPVGYAKNFQLQYDTYVKNTLERFTTQLIDLSDSLFSKVSKLDGVIGLKNTYTDPILGNLLGTIRQYWIPFCFIVGLIFLAAFMKMRRDLIESVVMVVVSLAITYAFVNIVPVYLPLAYNSVINNVSENLTYQILGTSAEINDVEDTHVSSVGDNGDFLNQTTSLTLYKVGTKDFADFANSLNVDQSQLLGGKKYIIDQASGLYAEGDKLKISADVLFDTLPITGSYEDSGEGTYTMKATKTVSNNMDYYAPYYQIVDGFVNKLNALAQIYDIPRKTTTYAQSTVKDSYLVYSFVNSPVFTTPGNYKQGEVEETNLSDADQEEEALNSKTVEEELTKEFGSGTDFLGIGDLVYNLGDSEKKTLWAQTMRKNGYYTADWEPVKDKLNSLVVYVNYQTKKFIYDMSDEVGSMSDDTMIKLISLRALVAFTQQASEYGDWLYPYCINYNEYNLGDIVKCIYTSDYNKYVNLDMDIVNYVGNDLGWFFLILFDASVILLYLIVFILKLLVSVLYVSLAILIIVKLFTQSDLKAPITGYFKCNVIVFALFTALSLCLVGVSKLDGSPIALFLTLLVLCLVAYVLATLLSSLIRGFATLGNETINAKITGLAQHLPFGRNMQQSMQVNTTNVNYGKRNSRTGFNPEERGVFDSYRIDQDVDDIDVGAGSFNPGSFSQGNFSQDDDLIEGIYENATRDNRDHRGGSR